MNMYSNVSDADLFESVVNKTLMSGGRLTSAQCLHGCGFRSNLKYTYFGNLPWDKSYEINDSEILLSKLRNPDDKVVSADLLVNAWKARIEYAAITERAVSLDEQHPVQVIFSADQVGLDEFEPFDLNARSSFFNFFVELCELSAPLYAAILVENSLKVYKRFRSRLRPPNVCRFLLDA